MVTTLRETNKTPVLNGRQNPYLFIVGCPRSGTTLLRRIVDAHPHIAITPESHWIPVWFEKGKCLTSQRFVTPDLISSLEENRDFGRWKLDHHALESLFDSDEPISYQKFVTGVFDLYGEVRGKTLVGNKTPGYTRKIRTLHALWPAARFVHLIRDGRDVCLSAVRWTARTGRFAETFPFWSDHPVYTAGLWWKWHVRLARETGSLLGSDLYYELRYESLVANPARECMALCDFLAVPYDDKMLRFYEGRRKIEVGLDAKKAWLPPTVGLRDWRTQMASGDLEQFEAVAGDMLEELGYPRAAHQPKAIAQRQASWIHDIFTRNAYSNGLPLPKAW